MFMDINDIKSILESQHVLNFYDCDGLLCGFNDYENNSPCIICVLDGAFYLSYEFKHYHFDFMALQNTLAGDEVIYSLFFWLGDKKVAEISTSSIPLSIAHEVL